MDSRKILLDYNLEEIKVIMKENGEASFRAVQVFNGLQLYKDFDEMSDISAKLKESLREFYIAKPIEIIQKLESKDGSYKFLYKLFDDNVIEGVLMKYKYGNTLCVSTQVGCRMNCAFCASGIGGLVRNLSAGEILSQVLAVNRELGGTVKNRQITNIVLMGSGEPLDNYDNVVKFLRLISDEKGLNISTRNISLSTCGIVPNIYRLSDEGFSLNLTISLHSPFDEERKKIMPIANKYKIDEIIDACKYYFEKTGRRYIFEYSLISGENDTTVHAEGLKKILGGLPCHINLIRLNEVKEKNLKGVSEKDAYRFMEKLLEKGLSATLRRQIGNDIEGACGQLRRKFLDN